MACYTDYTTVVPYNTDSGITNADVVNTIADYLVAHAGFTLIQHATTGVATSDTNYAILDFHNIFLKLTANSEYLGYIFWYMGDHTLGTTTILSSSIQVPIVAAANCTVTMRFYNVVSGTMIDIRTNSSNWASFFQATACTRLSNSAALYCAAVFMFSYDRQVVIPDGLSQVYYMNSKTVAAGYTDIDGVQQIMMPSFIATSSASSNYNARYILPNMYTIRTAIMTGHVQISGRYFNVGSYFAVELNS